MGTATLVRKITGGTGDARLFQLDPPMVYKYWDAAEQSYPFVVVSATIIPYGFGPETYIFPHDGSEKDWEGIIDWGELPGSMKGTLDHAEALRGAGYTIRS